MSCCGRGRTLQRSQPPISSAPLSRQAGAVTPAKPVSFTYAGNGSIQVTGPMTGRTYRFASGATLIVHALDAPAFIGVAGLKPIR
jgi:hypothetical protein